MRYDELRSVEQNFFKEITQNCSFIIETYLDSGFCLVRGMGAGFSDSPKDYFKSAAIKYRTSIDMPKAMHYAFSKAQKEAGIKARRDNSVFCTLNIMNRLDPSHFIMFPVNNSYFSYIHNEPDLYFRRDDYLIPYDKNDGPEVTFIDNKVTIGKDLRRYEVDPIYIERTTHGSITQLKLAHIGFNTEILIHGDCYYMKSSRLEEFKAYMENYNAIQ